jgi:hypothetical protein
MEEIITDQPSQTEKSLDEAANVRYLEQGDFELFRTEGGSLRITLKNDRSILRVKTRRCFPFSFTRKYISIRDGNEEEIGIIKDLAALSKEYRRWIEENLDLRYFTPVVKSIKSLKHRYGGVEWNLLTDRGARRIITKGVHDTMTEVEPGRYLITDVDGNRYEIFADKLDEQSRVLMDRLV